MFGKSYLDTTYNKQPKNINKSDLKSQPIIGTIIHIYYLVVSSIAIPIRLIIRHNFGERSITPLAWIISIGFHIWYIAEIVLLSPILVMGYIDSYLGNDYDLDNYGYIFGESINSVFGLFILLIFNGFAFYMLFAFLIKGIQHFRNVVKKSETKVILEEGSYYRGDSKYFNHRIGKIAWTPIGKFKIDEDVKRIYVEPWIMGKVGLTLSLIAFCVCLLLPESMRPAAIIISSLVPIGILILISSFCLFLEEIGLYLRLRSVALDVIDGDKELKAVMEQVQKISTQRINKTYKKDQINNTSHTPLISDGID